MKFTQLIGKIKGQPDYEKHFKQATDFLTKKGYIVINPVTMVQHHENLLAFELDEYDRLQLCKASIEFYFNDCNGKATIGKEFTIHALWNWRNSPGALEEKELADLLGIKTIELTYNEVYNNEEI